MSEFEDKIVIITDATFNSPSGPVQVNVEKLRNIANNPNAEITQWCNDYEQLV